MRLQSSSFPNPRSLLLRFAGVGLVVAMISSSPAFAATSTNAAPAMAPATNVAPPPSVTPAPAKSDDDDANDNGHSFKLNINTDHDDKPEGLMAQFIDDLIPLAGIAASFGTPILIVFFVCYFSYRRRLENVALARDYLAKGLPVPPELLDPTSSPYSRARPGGGASNCDIRRGFRLTFIGLAVTAALFIHNPHSTTWGWGLIPTIMGIGFLLSGWSEARRENRSIYPPEKPVPPPDSP